MSNGLKDNHMPALAIDFEATDATEDAQATEIGFCDVIFSKDGVLNPLNMPIGVLCQPERDISFGAMAVTGICPEDLHHAYSHREVVTHYMPAGAAYIIGHNIDYDLQVARNAGVDTSQYKAICTLAIARHLYPEADHKLMALLYMLDYGYAREYGKSSHSAAYDVRFCVRLLRIFCKEAGITNMEDLYQFSEMARRPKIMTFGMHKGESLIDLAATEKGRGYFFWLISDGLSDRYLLTEFHSHLTGTKLECTKGNKDYEKGQSYVIKGFVDAHKLTIANGENEDVLVIEKANRIILENNKDLAVFKPV